MHPAPAEDPGRLDEVDGPVAASGPGPADAPPDAAPSGIPLDGLSIAGITRRRAAFVLLALVTIWIVAVFARQVGDASAATGRAEVEAYRVRAGIQSALTGMKAAPPPPPPSAAPAGGPKKGGGGCSG